MFANASKFQVVFLGIKRKHNLCLDIGCTRVKIFKGGKNFLEVDFQTEF